MGFSSQEYWSGLPFPSSGDLPDPQIEPGSPALQADSLPSEPAGSKEYLYESYVLNFSSFPMLWHLGTFLTAPPRVSKFLEIIKTSAAAAKSLQSCPTLCDPIDGSPPGSPVPGILQARTLEWVAISFSNAWKWKVKVKSLSCVRLLATPWTAAYQAPPLMGFSRQEYWSGVPLPSPIVKTRGD